MLCIQKAMRSVLALGASYRDYNLSKLSALSDKYKDNIALQAIGPFFIPFQIRHSQ
jgi:hypothetical protein